MQQGRVEPCLGAPKPSRHRFFSRAPLTTSTRSQPSPHELPPVVGVFLREPPVVAAVRKRAASPTRPPLPRCFPLRFPWTRVLKPCAPEGDVRDGERGWRGVLRRDRQRVRDPAAAELPGDTRRGGQRRQGARRGAVAGSPAGLAQVRREFDAPSRDASVPPLPDRARGGAAATPSDSGFRRREPACGAKVCCCRGRKAGIDPCGFFPQPRCGSGAGESDSSPGPSPLAPVNRPAALPLSCAPRGPSSRPRPPRQQRRARPGPPRASHGLPEHRFRRGGCPASLLARGLFDGTVRPRRGRPGRRRPSARAPSPPPRKTPSRPRQRRRRQCVGESRSQARRRRRGQGDEHGMAKYGRGTRRTRGSAG